jgi:hypothetical protein
MLIRFGLLMATTQQGLVQHRGLPLASQSPITLEKSLVMSGH